MCRKGQLLLAGLLTLALNTAEAVTTEHKSTSAVHTGLYVGGAIAGAGIVISIVLAFVGCVCEQRQRGKPVDSKETALSEVQPVEADYQKGTVAGVPWEGNARPSSSELAAAANPYQPQAAPGAFYQPQAPRGAFYQPEAPLGGPYQPQAPPGAPYQAQDEPVVPYQAQDEPVVSYQEPWQPHQQAWGAPPSGPPPQQPDPVKWPDGAGKQAWS